MITTDRELTANFNCSTVSRVKISRFRPILARGCSVGSPRLSWWLGRISSSISNLMKNTLTVFSLAKKYDHEFISSASMEDLFHRELSCSGFINDEISYSAMPLTVVGIEK